MQIKAQEPAPEVTESVEPFDEDIVESHSEETVSYQTQKERKTSNIVLAILGLFLLTFIVTMIVVFCVKGSTPDILIQYTLGAGGVEALLLAGIKVSKVLAGSKSSPTPPDGMG